MKIRNDFVTNSSSSSFIIALREDCTRENIEKALLTQKKNIKNIIKDYDCNYEDKEKYEFDVIINNIVGNLFYGKQYGIKLDNWIVISKKYSNEDDIESCIMYSCGNLDSEKFKVKGYY